MRPVARSRQLLGELDALRLAARQRRRLLADLDVAEADLASASPACRAPTGTAAKNSTPSSTVMSRTSAIDLPLNVHLQRLAVVALAVADVAGDVDVGQEVHLDLDDAVALAGLAAPALDVEGEAAGLVAARLGLGQAGEPVADRREGAGVGGGVGARRAADRRLVDVDDLVEMLEARRCGRARPGTSRAPLSAARGGLVSVSIRKVDLPPPETPVTQVNSAERDFGA